MASVLISDIDDDLHRRLRDRAEANHRSLEEEARELLVDAVGRPNETRNEHVVRLSQRLFGTANGVELELPDRSRDLGRAPPDFSGPEYG